MQDPLCSERGWAHGRGRDLAETRQGEGLEGKGDRLFDPVTPALLSAHPAKRSR